jgi:hypothetical protein
VAASDRAFSSKLKHDLFEEDFTHSYELTEPVPEEWKDFLANFALEGNRSGPGTTFSDRLGACLIRAGGAASCYAVARLCREFSWRTFSTRLDKSGRTKS